jgi:hypothetical protein
MEAIATPWNVVALMVESKSWRREQYLAPDASCHQHYWFVLWGHMCRASVVTYAILKGCAYKFPSSCVLCASCDMCFNFCTKYFEFMGFVLYTSMAMFRYYFAPPSTTIKLCFQWLNATTTAYCLKETSLVWKGSIIVDGIMRDYMDLESLSGSYIYWSRFFWKPTRNMK